MRFPDAALAVLDITSRATAWGVSDFREVPRHTRKGQTSNVVEIDHPAAFETVFDLEKQCHGAAPDLIQSRLALESEAPLELERALPK